MLHFFRKRKLNSSPLFRDTVLSFNAACYPLQQEGPKQGLKPIAKTSNLRDCYENGLVKDSLLFTERVF